MEETLVREVYPYVFLFFLISHLWFRKDGCVDYFHMTKGVHDEDSDGQDARGHISAEHYNYNLHRHPKYYCNCPFKLERPLAGEHQQRVRTFLWLVFVFRTCSRGDVVHSCASKPSPAAVTWRCPWHQPADSRGRRCRVWGVVMSGRKLR